MKKETIKNRRNQDLVLIVEEVVGQKGLAFVMHGLGGFKEQPQFQVMADVFRENGYTVIRFDAANTIGESGGRHEDATLTNYYEDLEDVINWAKGQSWYQEPFCLAGASLGGICTALYAENYSSEVKALAPISTVVSGKLSMDIYPQDKLKHWQETGWRVDKSYSKPGAIKRLPWSYTKDIIKHDLLEKVDKLSMPILMIVGEKDNSTPLEHQKILYDKLPTDKKELHVIKGAEHTFWEESHLREIKDIFNNWLKKL